MVEPQEVWITDCGDVWGLGDKGLSCKTSKPY